MGMKGGVSFNGLRGKQLSLTLIALICVTVLLWAWEKTPLILPPQSRLEILSPVIINNVLSNSSASVHHETADEEDISIQAAEKVTRTEHSEKNTVKEPEVERRYKEPEVERRYKEPEVERRSDEGKHSAAGPVGSETASPLEKRDNGLTIQSAEGQGCNYAKGKWIADSRRPLYSGFACKKWLSQMWACRLTQRTDFSYEGFRWQPNNCEMLEFDGSTFLKRMQDKTVALVGDSLGRQQFQSLMCMVTGGEDFPEVEDIGWQYGLFTARGATRPDGWAYRFPKTNTTILYYWSASLCDLEPLNVTEPATSYAMHLDRPAAFLQQFLHRFDVLVLNTGHHWNRVKLNANRWVMYVGGKPLKDRKLAMIGNAKNLTIYSVVKWLDSQLPKHPRLKAFFRTISPRHFFNGDWNTGGSCDNTTPMAGGDTVSQDESHDPVVAGAVQGTGVKILDITALSELRDEGHISQYSIKASQGVRDCLHWCLPGVPDTWNEILAAQL